MDTRYSIFFFLLGVSMFELVIAKAPTVQITVTGPQLDQPLHVTNKPVTDANVWTGNFINSVAGIVSPSKVDHSSYRLHFWVRLNADDTRMMYVLNYQWSTESDRAVVCLPGKRDTWYSLNVSTILREEKDGNCFYAEENWGRAVNAALTIAM